MLGTEGSLGFAALGGCRAVSKYPGISRCNASPGTSPPFNGWERSIASDRKYVFSGRTIQADINPLRGPTGRCRPRALTRRHFWRQVHLAVAISAARMVFRMSMAMVIGPTPPGLGVILPATG